MSDDSSSVAGEHGVEVTHTAHTQALVSEYGK